MLMEEMQSRFYGMSSREVAEFMECGDRTAQRIIGSLKNNDPRIEIQEVSSEGPKRWKIKKANLPEFGFDPDELALMQQLLKASAHTLPDLSRRIQRLIGKLRCLNPRARNATFENDFDPLLNATGFATRPGPREPIEFNVYRALSDAIRSGQVLDIDYAKAENKKDTHRLCPLGLLYGERNYLIAYYLGSKPKDHRMFALPKIDDIKETNEVFNVDATGFDLAAYAAQSFGIFQSVETWDVEWIFSANKKIRRDVRGYQFHPSQTLEELKDGRLRVRFQAKGLVEMCHELFKWGRHVEIIGPIELKQMYDAMRGHEWSRWDDQNRWENLGTNSRVITSTE